MKKTSRIIAGVMLAVALVFCGYAIHHPELSWPWSNGVTFTLYGIYTAVMVLLFIAPFKSRKS